MRQGATRIITRYGVLAGAVALVMLDACSTWWLLTRGGTTFREADPIVAGVLSRWGWPAYFAADALRALLLIGGLTILAAATKRHPLLRIGVFTAALALLAYPVAMNTLVLLHIR